MSSAFELADELIAQQAAADPILATFDGIAGYENVLTDYSPSGYEARARLNRRFHQRMSEVSPGTDRDRLTRGVVLERLERSNEWFDRDEHLRDISFSWSPAQGIRSVFDQMPRDTSDQWSDIAARISGVPYALASCISTLRAGMANDVVAARRQVIACAQQARVWAGTEAGSEPTFSRLADEYAARSGADRKLEDRLREAAVLADSSFDDFATFLTKEYAPAATQKDAVGRERYITEASSYLGMRPNPDEIYEWGWEELQRLSSEIDKVCTDISSGSSRAEVIEMLNDDHERWVQGEEQLVDWLQALLDNATSKLNGIHFDIPEPLRRIDVRIAPPGGPVNQYYVGPSEDLQRPGTYWYPTTGRTRFPMWTEISTAYHEGVPGHHLQNGWVKVMYDELSRFQRNLFISGHGEGWALYAERLMDELGFLDRPEYRLDMLFNHLFRAARIVVDIGMHLELQIPKHQPFHPGETWTPELAYDFMMANSNETSEFMQSEILRYLGIPGQAISYKVGEKVWLEARIAAARRHGGKLDLKAFHTHALSIGPMGLAQLREELARF